MRAFIMSFLCVTLPGDHLLSNCVENPTPLSPGLSGARFARCCRCSGRITGMSVKRGVRFNDQPNADCIPSLDIDRVRQGRLMLMEAGDSIGAASMEHPFEGKSVG